MNERDFDPRFRHLMAHMGPTMAELLMAGDRRRCQCHGEPGEPGLFVRTTDEASVRQTEDAAVITMDMPGVPRENVDITVEMNRLVLEGRRAVQAEGRPPVLRAMFLVDDGFDVEKAEAKLDLGVLTLTLPRKRPPVVHIPVA